MSRPCRSCAGRSGRTGRSSTSGVLKVDVEGAELLVLRGAAGLLARQKPVVVFQFGLGAANHYGHGPREIFELFASHGMGMFTLAGLLEGAAPLTVEALEREYASTRVGSITSARGTSRQRSRPRSRCASTRAS
jgi:hypothetical protein